MIDFKKFLQFDKIVVTGPQRAGTRICSRILSGELKYKYIDEKEIKTRSLSSLFSMLLKDEKSVIQCPALSQICHLIDVPKVAVVFMIRDIESIIKSQDRIDWTLNYQSGELEMYFKKDGIISSIKYNVWNNFQKAKCQCPCFEIKYQDLQDHPKWIDEGRRKNFKWHQTVVSKLLM